jgi:hypothetical protein
MMDLNKHIVKNDDNKPFHSNGYAQVANGNRLGAVASVSFNQRQQIEYNRRVVGGYSRSAIGSLYNSTSRARPMVRGRGVSGQTSIGAKPSLQQHNSLNVGPRHFSEPSSRKYNPYS